MTAVLKYLANKLLVIVRSHMNIVEVVAAAPSNFYDTQLHGIHPTFMRTMLDILGIIDNVESKMVLIGQNLTKQRQSWILNCTFCSFR